MTKTSLAYTFLFLGITLLISGFLLALLYEWAAKDPTSQKTARVTRVVTRIGTFLCLFSIFVFYYFAIRAKADRMPDKGVSERTCCQGCCPKEGTGCGNESPDDTVLCLNAKPEPDIE